MCGWFRGCKLGEVCVKSFHTKPAEVRNHGLLCDHALVPLLCSLVSKCK